MSKKVKDEMDINPYELDKLSKVPSWLIILLLKYWAAAAAVFFIAIGGVDLGFDWSLDSDDLITRLVVITRLCLMIGLFMALFVNYIVRPIVRLMYNRRNNTYRYNLINVKGFKSFLLCFPYMLAISAVLCPLTIFLGQHGLVFDPFGTTGGAGIEPFTYAFYFVVLDALCILLKNVIANALEKRKYNKQIKGE